MRIKSNTIATSVILFSFLHSSSIAFAATMPVEGPQKLTLSVRDAVQTVLERNPDVLNGREKLEEANANSWLALSQVLPTLTGNASAVIEKDPVNSGSALFNGTSYNKYVAQLKLTQPLYQGGALLAGLSAAKKDKEIRRYNLEILERDITTQVIQAYYSVFTNKRVYETLLENQKVQKESLATAERYYKIGRGQKLDVLQIKSQIALLEPQLATANNQMRAAVSQLTTLLHENQATEVTLLGSVNTVDADLVRKLLPERKKLPEISQGETTISQFADKKDLTMAPYYPNLSLQSTYGQTSTSKTDLFSDYANGWTIGLFLTVPIFNGLASVNERHALASQTAQLEYTQTKLLDTLSNNQILAERNLDTLSNVLKGSQEAAKLAGESLKEALREYKIQTINYLQLLTSETNDLTAQVSAIQASGNYINALTNFCQSSGIPLDRLVDLLNKPDHQ